LSQIRRSVRFLDRSLEDLRNFPVEVRQEAGHQIDLVQLGLDPDDWKPMATIGPGVRELRIRERSGAFRVIYVAKGARSVFILHCFQKKTQRTAKLDVETARERYKSLPAHEDLGS
jgi:phage-related protein